MNTIKFIPVILVIFFNSCSDNNKEEQIKNEKRAEKIIIENDKIQRVKVISKLSNKFNARISFDTLEYQFTYQYQKFLNQNNKIIIEDFEITNIDMKDDSSFLVSIKKGVYREKFIDFLCTKSELYKICQEPLNDEPIKNLIEDRFLILKLNSVKKIKLKIDSDGENTGEGDINTYIQIKASEAFIFKAEFIDTYLKNEK